MGKILSYGFEPVNPAEIFLCSRATRNPTRIQIKAKKTLKAANPSTLRANKAVPTRTITPDRTSPPLWKKVPIAALAFYFSSREVTRKSECLVLFSRVFVKRTTTSEAPRTRKPVSARSNKVAASPGWTFVKSPKNLYRKPKERFSLFIPSAISFSPSFIPTLTTWISLCYARDTMSKAM